MYSFAQRCMWSESVTTHPRTTATCISLPSTLSFLLSFLRPSSLAQPATLQTAWSAKQKPTLMLTTTVIVCSALRAMFTWVSDVILMWGWGGCGERMLQPLIRQDKTFTLYQAELSLAICRLSIRPCLYSYLPIHHVRHTIAPLQHNDRIGWDANTFHH